MHLFSAKDLSKKTREVFHKIHLAQKDCSESRERMETLLNTKYLRLDEGYFQNKTCVDIACGSAVVGTVNLLNLNAKFVYLSDVDDSYIETATKILSSNENYKDRWQTDIANAEELPYADESIDFALAQGFLMTLENEEKSLAEIYRILKPGGKAYVDLTGSGGLIGNFVMKTMRDEYRDNKTFKDLIDNDLNVDAFRNILNGLKKNIDNDNSTQYKNCIKFIDTLSALIDDDLMLTIEDRIYSPLYRQTTEKEFINKLKKAGFSSWYRVSKKPKYNNIRKILAPLYKNYNDRLAKILFGDGGMINMVITK